MSLFKFIRGEGVDDNGIVMQYDGKMKCLYFVFFCVWMILLGIVYVECECEGLLLNRYVFWQLLLYLLNVDIFLIY